MRYLSLFVALILLTFTTAQAELPKARSQPQREHVPLKEGGPEDRELDPNSPEAKNLAKVAEAMKKMDASMEDYFRKVKRGEISPSDAEVELIGKIYGCVKKMAIAAENASRARTTKKQCQYKSEGLESFREMFRLANEAYEEGAFSESQWRDIKRAFLPYERFLR